MTSARPSQSEKFKEEDEAPRGGRLEKGGEGQAGAGEAGAIRRASCHCGSVTVDCRGEPSKVSLCHCSDCQKRTGSLFSVAAFYPRANVRLLAGQMTSFHRSSASGFGVTFHFCPQCGSNVYWEADRLPDFIGLAVGTFADPHFPAPEQAVWDQRRHEWLKLPDSFPSHSRNPVRPSRQDESTFSSGGPQKA